MKEALRIKIFRGILDNLLFSKGLNEMFRISIGEDYMGCPSDVRIRKVSDLSKHVDLKYRFLIDPITKGEVDTQYVQTIQTIADLLSKNVKKLGSKNW